jgi:hypothetical protein
MFLTPLQIQFLDDRSAFPWITLAPLEYECELTGETYTVPKHFRTDGASVPMALAALPVVGAALAMRYFGSGVWHGFKQGVLHDFLRRGDNPPVPAQVAHRIFRAALYEAGYPPDLCESYYSALVAFNS